MSDQSFTLDDAECARRCVNEADIGVTSEVTEDFVQRFTALISAHTGRLRQRIAELERELNTAQAREKLSEQMRQADSAAGQELITQLRERLSVVENQNGLLKCANDDVRRIALERDRYWELLCKTVENLGKVSPEAAPYADQWAKKVFAELSTLRQQAAKDQETIRIQQLAVDQKRETAKVVRVKIRCR